MRLNYTWPGRFHLIFNGSGGAWLYVTLWFHGQRYHYLRAKSALLAQRIEHRPSKPGADGSNPSERAP